MKRALEIVAIILTIVVVVCGILYLFCSIYEWNLNIAKWGKGVRLSFSFIGIILSSIVCFVALDKSS